MADDTTENPFAGYEPRPASAALPPQNPSVVQQFSMPEASTLFLDKEFPGAVVLKPPAPFDGLKHGRHVDFIMPNGEHRAAIVSRCHSQDSGLVNLQVITDGYSDHINVSHRVSGHVPAMVWFENIPYAPASEQKTYTWHWPHED